MKVEFYQPLGHELANAHVQDALLARFRGFTAFPGSGAWRMASGEVVREPVEVLTVFTEERGTALFHFLWELALQYGREARQEAVLFTIDNKPSLVFTEQQEEVTA